MRLHDDDIEDVTPVTAISDPETAKIDPRATGGVESFSARILRMAKSHLGATQTGDPVPFWIAKALAESKGIVLSTPPLAYADFIAEAASIGVLADATRPQRGDIGILQYGCSEAYWSFIVTDVFEREIEIIVAQSFNAYLETEVRTLRLGWPNYNDSWHVAGIIRL